MRRRSSLVRQLVRDEVKIAVSQLKAVDEAQEQDIMKLTAGASDTIGQQAAAAAHVAQHVAWVTAALATAEQQLVAITATLSSGTALRVPAHQATALVSVLLILGTTRTPGARRTRKTRSPRTTKALA